MLKKKKSILRLFHVLLFCYDYVPDVEPGRAWGEKIRGERSGRGRRRKRQGARDRITTYG